ncbi:unnamed protein product, partial [Discosporangium mesarthrocarpum]
SLPPLPPPPVGWSNGALRLSSRHCSLSVACRNMPGLLDAITRGVRCATDNLMEADVMTSMEGISLARFLLEVMNDDNAD